MHSSVSYAVMHAFSEIWNLPQLKCLVILFIVIILLILAVIVLLVAFVSAQKKKDTCWHHYQEDPDHINEVYYPHDTDCRFYYQCSAHGRVRMKCQPGEKITLQKLNWSCENLML